MQDAKKFAKYEIPREINTVENLSRLLPFKLWSINTLTIKVLLRIQLLLCSQVLILSERRVLYG